MFPYIPAAVRKHLPAILIFCAVLILFATSAVRVHAREPDTPESSSVPALHNGGILYDGHIYRLNGNRLECDGIPVDIMPLFRIALADDVLYAVTEEGEHWIMLNSNLSNGSGNAVLSSAADNEREIYRFARDTLKVNTAVACAILANIYAESSFNPHSQTLDTNGLISYGICQWNGGRFTALQNWCEQNGYDYTTMSGQLYYLQSELEGGERNAFNRVKESANTADGTYEAAYNWARYFERCAAKYFVGRAERAQRVYWTSYAGESYTAPESSLYVKAVSMPSGKLEPGRSFPLRGIIASSKGNITQVRAYITDQNSGETVRTYQVEWFRNSYDIRADGLNDSFIFGTLSDGRYLYRVEADADEQTLTLLSSAFTIGNPVDNPVTQTVVNDVIWIGNSVRADVICTQEKASVWCAGYNANGKLLCVQSLPVSPEQRDYQFTLSVASGNPPEEDQAPDLISSGAESHDELSDSTSAALLQQNSVLLQLDNQIMQVKVFVLDADSRPLCDAAHG